MSSKTSIISSESNGSSNKIDPEKNIDDLKPDESIISEGGWKGWSVLLGV
jgi:hypothetical protein